MLTLKSDQCSKKLSYIIILRKMTTQGQLKYIKKDPTIHNKFCLTCGEDRHCDNPMHYYLTCMPAKIILEAADKQVEKECSFQYIIDGKKIRDPDNRIPMDRPPTDMQRLCIFMNLPGECSSTDNDAIATTIIC